MRTEDWLESLFPYYDVEIQRTNRWGEKEGNGRNSFGEKTWKRGNWTCAITDATDGGELIGTIDNPFHIRIAWGDGDTIGDAVANCRMSYDDYMAHRTESAPDSGTGESGSGA